MRTCAARGWSCGKFVTRRPAYSTTPPLLMYAGRSKKNALCCTRKSVPEPEATDVFTDSRQAVYNRRILRKQFERIWRGSRVHVCGP